MSRCVFFFSVYLTSILKSKFSALYGVTLMDCESLVWLWDIFGVFCVTTAWDFSDANSLLFFSTSRWKFCSPLCKLKNKLLLLSEVDDMLSVKDVISFAEDWLFADEVVVVVVACLVPFWVVFGLWLFDTFDMSLEIIWRNLMNGSCSIRSKISFWAAFLSVHFRAI